jgi:transcriptional regulator with XRE-family HTH domain
MTEFSQRFEIIRKSKSLTKKEVARRMNKTPQWLNQYAGPSASSEPGYDTLGLFAIGLDTEVGVFFPTLVELKEKYDNLDK